MQWPWARLHQMVAQMGALERKLEESAARIEAHREIIRELTARVDALEAEKTTRRRARMPKVRSETA